MDEFNNMNANNSISDTELSQSNINGVERMLSICMGKFSVVQPVFSPLFAQNLEFNDSPVIDSLFSTKSPQENALSSYQVSNSNGEFEPSELEMSHSDNIVDSNSLIEVQPINSGSISSYINSKPSIQPEGPDPNIATKRSIDLECVQSNVPIEEYPYLFDRSAIQKYFYRNSSIKEIIKNGFHKPFKKEASQKSDTLTPRKKKTPSSVEVQIPTTNSKTDSSRLITENSQPTDLGIELSAKKKVKIGTENKISDKNNTEPSNINEAPFSHNTKRMKIKDKEQPNTTLSTQLSLSKNIETSNQMEIENAEDFGNLTQEESVQCIDRFNKNDPMLEGITVSRSQPITSLIGAEKKSKINNQLLPIWPQLENQFSKKNVDLEQHITSYYDSKGITLIEEILTRGFNALSHNKIRSIQQEYNVEHSIGTTTRAVEPESIYAPRVQPSSISVGELSNDIPNSQLPARSPHLNRPPFKIYESPKQSEYSSGKAVRYNTLPKPPISETGFFVPQHDTKHLHSKRTIKNIPNHSKNTLIEEMLLSGFDTHPNRHIELNQIQHVLEGIVPFEEILTRGFNALSHDTIKSTQQEYNVEHGIGTTTHTVDPEPIDAPRAQPSSISVGELSNDIPNSQLPARSPHLNRPPFKVYESPKQSEYSSGKAVRYSTLAKPPISETGFFVPQHDTKHLHSKRTIKNFPDHSKNTLIEEMLLSGFDIHPNRHIELNQIKHELKGIAPFRYFQIIDMDGSIVEGEIGSEDLIGTESYFQRNSINNLDTKDYRPLNNSETNSLESFQSSPSTTSASSERVTKHQPTASENRINTKINVCLDSFKTPSIQSIIQGLAKDARRIADTYSVPTVTNDPAIDPSPYSKLKTKYCTEYKTPRQQHTSIPSKEESKYLYPPINSKRPTKIQVSTVQLTKCLPAHIDQMLSGRGSILEHSPKTKPFNQVKNQLVNTELTKETGRAPSNSQTCDNESSGNTPLYPRANHQVSTKPKQGSIFTNLLNKPQFIDDLTNAPFKQSELFEHPILTKPTDSIVNKASDLNQIRLPIVQNQSSVVKSPLRGGAQQGSYADKNKHKDYYLKGVYPNPPEHNVANFTEFKNILPLSGTESKSDLIFSFPQQQREDSQNSPYVDESRFPTLSIAGSAKSTNTLSKIKAFTNTINEGTNNKAIKRSVMKHQYSNKQRILSEQKQTPSAQAANRSAENQVVKKTIQKQALKKPHINEISSINQRSIVHTMPEEPCFNQDTIRIDLVIEQVKVLPQSSVKNAKVRSNVNSKNTSAFVTIDNVLNDGFKN